MRNFNLLSDYPKSQTTRYVGSNLRTIKHRIVASYRDKEFYDGDRNYGYGGFKYDGRWQKIANKICKEYNLNNESSFLQLNCEKGFLLNDLKIEHKDDYSYYKLFELNKCTNKEYFNFLNKIAFKFFKESYADTYIYNRKLQEYHKLDVSINSVFDFESKYLLFINPASWIALQSDLSSKFLENQLLYIKF